jgi:hypothetical protein
MHVEGGESDISSPSYRWNEECVGQSDRTDEGIVTPVSKGSDKVIGCLLHRGQVQRGNGLIELVAHRGILSRSNKILDFPRRNDSNRPLEVTFPRICTEKFKGQCNVSKKNLQIVSQ